MYNPIKPKNAVHPSISALALLGPRAMQVIDRHKSNTIIAAYEQTLGPKVGSFKEARGELMMLVAVCKKQSASSAAEIAALDAVIRGWGTQLQLGTALETEEIGITEARTPEAKLDSAESVMTMLRGQQDLPFAAQALSDIEAQYSVAQAAYDATQAGRIAVQAKQAELQAVAAAVQKELVKLRKALRIVLGTSHLDFQRLRLRVGRTVVDDPDETVTEPTPGAAAITAQSAGTGSSA